MAKEGAVVMNLREQVIRNGLRRGDKAILTRTFCQADVTLFGRVTGDLNPYHFDQRFGVGSRFGRLIAHGLLVASMLTEVGGQWAWLATEMSFSFLAPVYPGDTITLELTVVDQDEKNFTRAQAHWTNQDGQTVITGTLGGYPPTRSQRKLLEGVRYRSK